MLRGLPRTPRRPGGLCLLSRPVYSTVVGTADRTSNREGTWREGSRCFSPPHPKEELVCQGADRRSPRSIGSNCGRPMGRFTP